MAETETVNTSVRLPRDLHERLRLEASRQDRSAHSLIVHYVRRGLAEDERRAREDEDR